MLPGPTPDYDSTAKLVVPLSGAWRKFNHELNAEATASDHRSSLKYSRYSALGSAARIGHLDAQFPIKFTPGTTKAQRKELLRRDGWQCQTPGCSCKVWLHLHHLVSYSDGGETRPETLITLCASCHRNLHNGHLQIVDGEDGQLLFLDGEGRRLDRLVNLEMACWLDWWHGWKGEETDSHGARVFLGERGFEL